MYTPTYIHTYLHICASLQIHSNRLEFIHSHIHSCILWRTCCVQRIYSAFCSWAKKLLLKVQDSNDSGDMAVKEMRGVLGSLADADGNISGYIRMHIHTSKCIYIRAYMYKHIYVHTQIIHVYMYSYIHI